MKHPDKTEKKHQPYRPPKKIKRRTPSEQEEFRRWWGDMVENRKRLRKKRQTRDQEMTLSLAERIALQRKLNEEEREAEVVEKTGKDVLAQQSEEYAECVGHSSEKKYRYRDVNPSVKQNQVKSTTQKNGVQNQGSKLQESPMTANYCDVNESSEEVTMGRHKNLYSETSVAIHQKHKPMTNDFLQNRTKSNVNRSHEMTISDALNSDKSPSMTCSKSLRSQNNQSIAAHKPEHRGLSSSQSTSRLSMDNTEQSEHWKQRDGETMSHNRYTRVTKEDSSYERPGLAAFSQTRNKSSEETMVAYKSIQKQISKLRTLDSCDDTYEDIDDESSSDDDVSSQCTVADNNLVRWDSDESVKSNSSGASREDRTPNPPLVSKLAPREQQVKNNATLKHNADSNTKLPVIEEKPSLFDDSYINSEDDSFAPSESISLPSIYSSSNSLVSRFQAGTYSASLRETPLSQSPARWPNSVYRIPRHLRHLGNDFDTLMSFPHTESHLSAEAQIRVRSLPNAKTQERIVINSPRVRSNPSSKHRTHAHSKSLSSSPRLLNRFRNDIKIEQLERELDANLQDILAKYPVK